MYLRRAIPCSIISTKSQMVWGIKLGMKKSVKRPCFVLIRKCIAPIWFPRNSLAPNLPVG